MTKKLQAITPGGRLKELREAHGWLQSEVCEKTGMSQSNYSKYEKDQIVRPDPDIFSKFSELYGVPINVLMCCEDPFEHLPPRVREMIQHEDSVPFLINAYKEYKKAQLEKEIRELENPQE